MVAWWTSVFKEYSLPFFFGPTRPLMLAHRQLMFPPKAGLCAWPDLGNATCHPLQGSQWEVPIGLRGTFSSVPLVLLVCVICFARTHTLIVSNPLATCYMTCSLYHPVRRTLHMQSWQGAESAPGITPQANRQLQYQL